MRTPNMNKPLTNLAPTRIARGVDTNKFRTTKPSLQELMMEAGEYLSGWTEPFHPHNHQDEMLQYADIQGQYNSWGNFAYNARARYSRRRAMHRLRMDAELVRLINHERPRI